MATLSELNKQERDIKGKISSLRRDMRSKKITKKKFDSQFESYSRKLEQISEKKNKLIGLPPIPPAPRPSVAHFSDLGDIKKAVVSGSVEPPKPPSAASEPARESGKKAKANEKAKAGNARAGQKGPSKKAASPKSRKSDSSGSRASETAPSKPKVITKEVPVYRDRIQRVEVPVIRERIKRVEVPVVKERVKEVPVIKTVKVPADDPKIAKSLQKALSEVSNLKLDVSRHEKENTQIAKDIKTVRNDIDSMQGLKAELKSLDMRIKSMQKAEALFDKGMNAERSNDIKALQMDVNKNEREIEGMATDIKDLKQASESIEPLSKDVSALRDRLGKMDFEGLGKEIYSQFQRMNEEISQSTERNDDAVERLKVEMKTLTEKLGSVQKMEEQFEQQDVPGLKRDIEALKQRNQHLEQQLSGIEIKPLVDMLRDMESRITHIQNQSAFVIE